MGYAFYEMFRCLDQHRCKQTHLNNLVNCFVQVSEIAHNLLISHKNPQIFAHTAYNIQYLLSQNVIYYLNKLFTTPSCCSLLKASWTFFFFSIFS